MQYIAKNINVLDGSIVNYTFLYAMISFLYNFTSCFQFLIPESYCDYICIIYQINSSGTFQNSCTMEKIGLLKMCQHLHLYLTTNTDSLSSIDNVALGLDGRPDNTKMCIVYICDVCAMYK